MPSQLETPAKSPRDKLVPFVENISESAAACLFTMVQGNVLALGLSHWLIASQTGLVAGLLTGVALMVTHSTRRWVIALILGVITAAVDYVVHPGMFGPQALEAIVTGLGAAVLSLFVSWVLDWRRARAAISG